MQAGADPRGEGLGASAPPLPQRGALKMFYDIIIM